MQYGIDHFLQSRDSNLRKSNWGLVTNDAARTGEGHHSRAALLRAGWQIECLFSPEHGLSAAAADGQAQPHGRDPLTSLPVYSLYGPQFAPTLGALKNADGILFDLPDAGVRFYTYIWTLSYVMEACLAIGKPLVVLDRPNPLSGQLALAEGPMLDEANLSSFIGRWRLPIRHSLSMGELARFWRAKRKMAALDLTVIPCRDWDRRQYLVDIDRPFYPPSPALNRPETLLTYPALCFMEGVNVSEGRGTPLSFQWFGAPWLDGEGFTNTLNTVGFPGVLFEGCRFKPVSGRYAGEDCRGVRLRVTDRDLYRPVRTGIGILALLKLHYPEAVQWAAYPTHANPPGAFHLDLLLGDGGIRRRLETAPEEVLNLLPELTAVADWEDQVGPSLLYTGRRT